jgi:hypothetical protein
LVESDRDGFIRLAHPLGLGTQVTQDGRFVTPLADVQSLIVLPLHAGQNDFVIAPMPSRLRRLSFWVTAGMLAGLLILAVVRAMGDRLSRHFRHPLAGR